jgi:transglutaminase-like putative cysteine protease
MEEQHDSSTAHRLVLLVAVVALAVTGAVAFGRVFRGPGAAARLGVAAGVAVLLAGAMERRNVFLATLVSAAGLALMMAWLVFPETTRYLLPTARTYRAIVHAWKTVGPLSDQEIAPTRPLDPLFLAALTAVWTASYSSHVLAVRARSPLLAIVPPGALLAFTSILLHDGPRPLYVGAFLASAMAVLFADSLRRIGSWGPLTMWHGRRRRLSTLKGARRIALACVGLAVLAPGILPGFRAQGWVDVHSKNGSARVSLDPIVDIRPALLQTPVLQLFSVRSSAPGGSYWRLLSLDRFDGQRWSASNPTATGGVELERGDLRSVSPAGPLEPNVIPLQQHVTLDRLGGDWLPVSFEPIRLAASGQRVRWDPVSSTLVSTNGTYEGLSYDVTSEVLGPTPEQLDAILPDDAPGLARYETLPPVPQEIYQIAHQITDRQTTMYRKVLAIQDYLRSNFRYDEHVVPGHDVNHILYFLTRSRAGYCEQFAGTMTVLLRALHIPARVAVGFTQGTHDPKTGLWDVTTKNAHSWVEVFFPGQGWLAFEPTPSRSNPGALGYTTASISSLTKKNREASVVCPWKRGMEPDASCRALPKSKQSAAPPATEPPAREPRDAASGELPPPPRFQRSHGWRWWAVRGIALIALLLLIALPLIKLIRRRLALTSAGGPRERVLAAYALMADRASDVGLRKRPAETLWEYRTRLKDEVVFSNGHLDRLTRLASFAAYSESEMSPADADQALDAARVAAKDIVRSRGPARQLAGWFGIATDRD